MKNRTLWLLLSLLLVVSLVMAACKGEEATEVTEATEAPEPTTVATEAPEPTAKPTARPTETEEPEPKILRIRAAADAGNLDPAFTLSLVDNIIGMAIFNGLVQWAPNSYDLEYQLAEWIEMSEDGLEVSFKLKEGILWQKGYGELTTEDVKYSYERMIDPELASAYADDWVTLDHVEIIDEYEGKIILKEPLATLWTTTLPFYSGNIVCKKQVEEIGVEEFGMNPVGTGPYLFHEWKPNEMVVLRKNPDYFGEPPYWDEIQVIPIVDTQVAEVALIAGEIDISRISEASVESFETDPAFKVHSAQTLGYGWIGMNLENPKLQDINIRQAIRYALDVPTMLAATYSGQAEQATTMIPLGVLGYWEDAPLYEQDIETAKEYMDKAGVDSLDLEIAIYDYITFRSWAEIAQSNLAEIGINLTVNPMDAGTFLSLGGNEELELFVNMYSGMPDPAWFTMWFTCDQVGLWNYSRWCSEEYDELHQRGMVTLDIEERNQIYTDMEKLVDEAVHAVWIVHPPAFDAYSTDIIPAFTPNGVMQIANFQPAD